MAEHNELGALGEKLAVAYLKENGYEVLETNWRSGQLEIDIIAKNKDFIIVAEVKTRSTNVFGEPEEFVNKQKQKLLIRAASDYVVKMDLDTEVRFDIISVLIKGNKNQVNHIIDAFYARL